MYISLSVLQGFKVYHRPHDSLALRLWRIVERGGLWGQARFEPVSSWLRGFCCGGGAERGCFRAALRKPAHMLDIHSSKFIPESWRLDLDGERAGVGPQRSDGEGRDSSVLSLPTYPEALYLFLFVVIASSPKSCLFTAPWQDLLLRPGIVPDLIDLCWKLQELILPLIFSKLNTAEGWDDGKWPRVSRTGHCSGYSCYLS